MSLTGLSSVVVNPASGNAAGVTGQPQREPPPSLGAATATTIPRGDDSGSGNKLLTDAKNDLHYFDVLHPILLSHVRRANSGGVLALLSLPSIAESDVFWRTCTYREGLVAAVLIHVMEHTGQLTVPASSHTFFMPASEAASPPGEFVNSNEQADDSRACSPEPIPQTKQQPSLPSSSPCSSPAPSVLPDAISVTANGFSPGTDSPHITPLTVDDLYVLLHLCSREGAGAGVSCVVHENVSSLEECRCADSAEKLCSLNRRHLPALTSLLRVGRALQQRRSGRNTWAKGSEASSWLCQPIMALREASADMDLERYIQSIMRRLEAMKGVQTHVGGQNLDTPAATTRKRLRSSAAPTTSSISTSNGPKRTDTLTSFTSDSLCDMRREVTAVAHTDAVDLEALAAVLQEHCHDMIYVNPFSERIAALETVDESTDSTMTTATTIMGVSSSNSNCSRTNTAHALCTTTAHITAGMATERTSIADLVRASPEAVSEGTEGTDADAAKDMGAQDASPGLDAVALLRRIPAISATRWTLPSGAGQTCAETQCPLSATATTAMAVPGAASVAADSLPLPRAPKWFSIPTTAVAPQPRETEEEERVSAAIRAFDAFTTALEQSAAHKARMPADPPQSSHALPAPSSSSSTGNIRSHRAAARLVTLDAHHPQPLVPPPPPPPPPSSSSSQVRRRYKFSPQEDAAILYGVARFGGMRGSFQYILHAYRGVWRTGRTALHLFDHWRGALRRRAVAAARSEATSHTDGIAFNEARDDGDDAVRMSPIDRGTPDRRQDLSSEIEDFSDEP